MYPPSGCFDLSPQPPNMSPRPDRHQLYAIRAAHLYDKKRNFAYMKSSVVANWECGIDHPAMPRIAFDDYANPSQRRPVTVDLVHKWFVSQDLESGVVFTVHDHFTKQSRVLGALPFSGFPALTARLVREDVYEYNGVLYDLKSRDSIKRLAFAQETGGYEPCMMSDIWNGVWSVKTGDMLSTVLAVRGSPVVVNGVVKDMGFVTVNLFNVQCLDMMAVAMDEDPRSVPFVLMEKSPQVAECPDCIPGLFKFCKHCVMKIYDTLTPCRQSKV